MSPKTKKIPIVNLPPDTLNGNICQSRVGKSAVERYIVNANNNSPDNTEIYKSAVDAFRRESQVILNFGSPLYSMHGAIRQESIKLYIIKVLLFIGTPPTGNGLAVLSRLIEILSVHPELTLEYVVSDFAKTHAATVDSVTRVIEKYLNIYDNYFYDRVVQLTKSHPMTAKDVLCDISVFIRAKFMSKAE